MCIPSEIAALTALRTQQILLLETGASRTIDPLAGSYYVESLTGEMEKRITDYTLHGGMIFALADVVLGAASNSHGRVAVAIQATISYIKAISEGVLTAETEELSRDSVLGLYNVRVTNDAGDLVAVFQGRVYLKRSP